MEPRKKLNLLEFALGQTRIEARKEKQEQFYAANEAAVKQLGKQAPAQVGHLKIKPVIDNKSHASQPQPLVADTPSIVDLNQMQVPYAIGKGTLADFVLQACKDANLTCQINVNQIQMTPVATAIAGKHAEDDLDCEGTTEASFVPVYAATSRNEENVLVIGYSTNGSVHFKSDLRVTHEMSCSNQSFRAIGIPNQAAQELSATDPKAFEKLQESAGILIFVRYEATSSLSYERNPEGIQKSLLQVYTPDVYSYVGQGQKINDQYRPTTRGPGRVTDVSMYVISPMVINTNGKTLSEKEIQTTKQLMKMRTTELSEEYKKFKTYTLTEILKELGDKAKTKNITNIMKTNLFEHTLLHYAGVKKEPNECHVVINDKTPPGYLLVQFAASDISTKETLQKFKQSFSDDCYETTYDHYGNSMFNWIAVPIKGVANKLDKLKETMLEMLDGSRYLLASEKRSSQAKPFIDTPSLQRHLEKMDGNVSMQKTRCMELVLLKMTEQPIDVLQTNVKGNTFSASTEGYVGQMLDTHFFLRLTHLEAKQFVVNFNKQFNSLLGDEIDRPAAKLIKTDSDDHCVIAIENEVLNSQNFQTLWGATYQKLQDDHPLIAEQLRIQSGKQSMTSQEAADKLLSLSEQFNNKNRSLARALHQFSDVLKSSTASNSIREDAKREWQKANNDYENTLTSGSLNGYKKQEKKEVKDALNAITPRRRM